MRERSRCTGVWESVYRCEEVNVKNYRESMWEGRESLQDGQMRRCMDSRQKETEQTQGR